MCHNRANHSEGCRITVFKALQHDEEEHKRRISTLEASQYDGEEHKRRMPVMRASQHNDEGTKT